MKWPKENHVLDARCWPVIWCGWITKKWLSW